MWLYFERCLYDDQLHLFIPGARNAARWRVEQGRDVEVEILENTADHTDLADCVSWKVTEFRFPPTLDLSHPGYALEYAETP